jgi:hypothetical protein
MTPRITSAIRSIPTWVWSVLLAALLTSLGFIFPKVLKHVAGGYYRWRDRLVFNHIRDAKGIGSLYDVEEIATALGKDQHSVIGSLRRLQEREKVWRYSDTGTGLWGLHELETPPSKAEDSN